jgi:hypothetical protein
MEDFVSMEVEFERRDTHKTAKSVKLTLRYGHGGKCTLWFTQEVKGVSHGISSAN